MKLQTSGTVSNRQFIGQPGSVYLSIPGGRSNPGKVTVRFNGATRELKAVADEPIPSGAAVEVVELLTDSLFLVKKS